MSSTKDDQHDDDYARGPNQKRPGQNDAAAATAAGVNVRCRHCLEITRFLPGAVHLSCVTKLPVVAK
jgi:hypothetical protein